MEERSSLTKRRIASILVLAAILFFALAKYYITNWAGELTLDIAELFGINSSEFQSLVKRLTQGKWETYKIGYFLYYPLYLSLHFIFIIVLFENPRTRFSILIIVASIIGLLVILTTIGTLTGTALLKHIPYKLFSKLFGLPFILLAIEGGRILIADIDRLYRAQTNENEN